MQESDLRKNTGKLPGKDSRSGLPFATSVGSRQIAQWGAVQSTQASFLPISTKGKLFSTPTGLRPRITWKLNEGMHTFRCAWQEKRKKKAVGKHQLFFLLAIRYNGLWSVLKLFFFICHKLGLKYTHLFMNTHTSAQISTKNTSWCMLFHFWGTK